MMFIKENINTQIKPRTLWNQAKPFTFWGKMIKMSPKSSNPQNSRQIKDAAHLDLRINLNDETSQNYG